MRPKVFAVVAASVLAAGLPACSSSAPALPTVLSRAPEPAVAPSPTRAPAGQVVSLDGVTPEGVVVAGRLAVIAARSPDHLVLLDAGTLAGQRSVAVPGAARHLQLTASGADVLVPGEDTDLVVTVDPIAGTVVSQAKVGRQPHDAADLGGGDVLDSDELGGSVTETRNGRVVGRLPGLVQPGGVAAASGRWAVVDVRARLLDVVGPGPRLLGRVAVGAGPTHVVALGQGLVAVADTSGGAVLVVRTTGTPVVLASFPLRGRPYGLAVDTARNRLWVTTTADDTLHELDIDLSGQPSLHSGATYPTVQQPNSVAVVPGTGRVLVVGAVHQGLVQAIDP